MRLTPLAVVALVAAACSGGGSSTHAVSAGSSGRTAAPTTTATHPGSTTASGVAISADTSVVRPGTTGARTTTAAPTAKGGVSPAIPAAPGTYKYRQSGSSTFGSSTKPVPSEGTTKIDPVTPQGLQTWHRTVDSAQPPSDTVFSFRNGGIFIVQIITRSNATGQTQTFTCTFNPPMPTPPWPPAVGGAYQGHGECGSFTVDVHGSVQSVRTVTVGTATRKAFVLASTLAFHGQLEGSGTETDWVDPLSSLILHEETSQQVTYGGFVHLGGAVTSDLESLNPA